MKGSSLQFLKNGNRGSVVLGVTSSISAYKAAGIASMLVRQGADVNVVMTENATRLVAPRTFTTLSRNQAVVNLWDVTDWRPEHIALADKTDLLLIAPATANVIGKLANGIADDALTTYALSHKGDVLVAPAMNPAMWRNAAVQENCRKLQRRGVRIIEPESGRVACGEEKGAGRLALPEKIVNAVRAHLTAKRWGLKPTAGKRLLITAGPTREPLDAVRFISNYSSGKMGYAIAEIGLALGFDTALVSGPVMLPPPAGVRLLCVETVGEMKEAVEGEFQDCDALIMAAAVGDFTVQDPAENKIKKKDSGSLCLELKAADDILAGVSDNKRAGQKIVGFAAETENVVENAREKLAAKSMDWVVANDVSEPGIGFGTEDNAVQLISAEKSEWLEKMSKYDIAARILKEVFAEIGCTPADAENIPADSKKTDDGS